MIDTTIHKRIEDKILDVLLLAQQIYKQPFDIPALEYKQMGRVAGKAWFLAWKVEINPDFLKNGHLEEMVNQTLPHELAHLISQKVYGRIIGGGHGRDVGCWWPLEARGCNSLGCNFFLRQAPGKCLPQKQKLQGS
jgi:hypothetical protein